MNRQYLTTFLSIFCSISFILSANAFSKAQTIVPDPQMIREMTAFARRDERASQSSRPRISDAYAIVQKNNFVADVEKTTVEVKNLERVAFEWLNQKRLAQGLTPLKWSEEVAKIARYHSQDMARNSYFSHKEGNGSMVDNRAALFGMDDWQSIGENIAFNRGFKLPAESACQQWMNSTAHRENILDKRWSEAGIGVAVAADGTYYFTEVFMLR